MYSPIFCSKNHSQRLESKFSQQEIDFLAIWSQIKLVDRHVEGVGNPKGKIVFDLKWA